ncbi:hypothetical protein DV738_g3752, partial [Chaetothyriales sp. CBS 135597]
MKLQAPEREAGVFDGHQVTILAYGEQFQFRDWDGDDFPNVFEYIHVSVQDPLGVAVARHVKLGHREPVSGTQALKAQADAEHGDLVLGSILPDLIQPPSVGRAVWASRSRPDDNRVKTPKQSHDILRERVIGINKQDPRRPAAGVIYCHATAVLRVVSLSFTGSVDVELQADDSQVHKYTSAGFYQIHKPTSTPPPDSIRFCNILETLAVFGSSPSPFLGITAHVSPTTGGQPARVLWPDRMEEEALYRDQTEIVWSDPGWIHSQGGWLHANNVLFYFAQSPFFDRSSENNTLFMQYANSEQTAEILGTRQRFESALRNRTGLSYVVSHDPLQPPKQVEAPDGTKLPANVWVIRKQTRSVAGDDSSVKVLAYYYIANQVVYEAPTVAKVLRNRMLNVTDSIGKIFAEASQYPLFSAAHGHTYVKPTQKYMNQKETAPSQPSKEATPMPGQEGPGADKAVDISPVDKSSKKADAQTLFQALRLTMSYGAEYSDETPLEGEPGHFRFAKKSEQVPKAVLPASVAPLQAPSASRKILADANTVESYNIVESGFIVCMVTRAPPPSTPAQSSSTPAPPAAPAPNAAPVSSNPPPATPTPAQPAAAAPQEPGWNNPSAMLMGSRNEETIREMEAMGFERSQIDRALRAAFYNPDRAIEYLLNGIPENIQADQRQAQAAAAQGNAPAPASAPAQTTASATAAADEPLVQQNPAMLEPILQQVAEGNPQLAQMIGQNQEQFLQLLAEDAGGNAIGGMGDSGPLPPGAVPISVTEEERDAIERLCRLGFSRDQVIQAYFACDKNEELAANFLFEQPDDDDLPPPGQ